MAENSLVSQTPRPPTTDLSPCSVEIVGLLSLPAHSVDIIEKSPVSFPKIPSAQNSPAQEDKTSKLAQRYATRSVDTAAAEDDEDELDQAMPLRRCISMPLSSFEGSQYRRKRDDAFPDVRLRRKDSVLSPLSLVKKVYGTSPLMVDIGVLMNRPDAECALQPDVCESSKRMQRTRAVIGRTQPPPAFVLPTIS